MRHLFLSYLGTLLFSCALTPVVMAQGEPIKNDAALGPAHPAKKPETQVKVFPLRNISTHSALNMVRSLGFRDLQLATDDRTNSLIVNGTQESIRNLESALTVMDVGQGPRVQAQIIRFSPALLQDSEKFLNRMANQYEVDAAISSGLGVILASGNQAAIENFVETLRETEKLASETKAVGQLQNRKATLSACLRISWLIEAGAPNDSLDEDLKAVVRKLEKTGIKGLHPAGQLLAHVEPAQGSNAPFSVNGLIPIDSIPTRFEAQGHVNAAIDGAIRTQVTIQVQPATEERGIGVDAEITLRPGKPIVIASSPFGIRGDAKGDARQSVFIVQLLEDF